VSAVGAEGNRIGMDRYERAASPILHATVYILALSICVPASLFPALFPGHRQFLVPLATALMLLAWVGLTGGRLSAIRGNLSLLWAALALFCVLAFWSSMAHPEVRESLALVAAYVARFAMLFVLVQILVVDGHLLVRVQRFVAGTLALLALLMVSGILDRFGSFLRLTEAAGHEIVRASAGLGDPNFTAFVFNVGLALALAWFATAETPRRRMVAGCAALLLVVGIGRTVSIGGLIGLIVILTLATWQMVPRAGIRKWGLALLSAGLLAVIAFAAGGVYLARIHQQIVRSERSIGSFGSERLNLTLGGIRMAQAHPLLGVGPANISADMAPYLLFPISDPNQGSHDGFISVMDETGIFSFFLLFGAGWVVIQRSGRVQRRLRMANERRAYLIGEGARIALISGLVQTLALGTQREPFLWFVIALVLAHATRVPPSGEPPVFPVPASG